MKISLTFGLAIATLAIAASASAQPVGRGPGRGPGKPPFAGALFPPELVMRHAQELGLEEAQREAIIREIQQMQSDVVPLQWQLREQSEVLRTILESSPVDEAKAMQRVDDISSVELQVKKAHLGLLIRIKNMLSDEQRAKLDEFRHQEDFVRGPPEPPPFN